MRIKSIEEGKISLLVSISVFLYFALLLPFPRGYILGAAGLMLLSLVALFRRSSFSIERIDRLIILALGSAGLLQIIILLYHRADLSDFELPSRYILSTLILILMLKFPPRFSWVLAGVISGAVLAAGLSWWELKQGPGIRATGFTGGIQFGNLGLMLGVFSSVGGLYFYHSRRPAPYCIAAIIGAGCGLFVSLASGSRGGWISLPIVAVILCIAYLNKRNWQLVAGTLVLLAGSLGFIAHESAYIQDRITSINTDVLEYEKGNYNTSIGARLALWQASAKLVSERPMLGWPRDEYKQGLASMVANGSLTEEPASLANTHNTFMESLVYTGCVGLIAILFLLGVGMCVFWRYIRSPIPLERACAASGLCLVACYIIFSQSQIMLGRNNTLLFFLLSLVIYWGMLRSPEKALGRTSVRNDGT